MAAPPALLRGFPFLRLRLRFRLRLHQTSPPPGVFSLLRRPKCSSASASESIQAESESNELLRVQSLSKLLTTTTSARADDPDYRKWKDKENEILRDIQPTSLFAKHILHSHRYMDGERLTKDDEKFVLDNLLAYHPHTVDKIGCGLDSIMVDRHPQFKHSRCLFVVRTDGGWIDFSYQKCLREYIRKKYPSYAERFIREHFKRSSG